jgi:hypothetical protein
MKSSSVVEKHLLEGRLDRGFRCVVTPRVLCETENPKHVSSITSKRMLSLSRIPLLLYMATEHSSLFCSGGLVIIELIDLMSVRFVINDSNSNSNNHPGNGSQLQETDSSHRFGYFFNVKYVRICGPRIEELLRNS